MEFTSFQQWYISVLESIYYILESFQSLYMLRYVLEQYDDCGAFQRQLQKKFVAVLRTSRKSTSQSNVDRQTSLVVDRHVCRSTAKREKWPACPDRRIARPTSITKLPLTDLYLIFLCSANVHTLFVLSYFHTTNFRVFSRLERRSKTPSELSMGTPVFLPYSIICSLFRLLSCLV